MPSQKDRSHLNNNFIPIILTEIAISLPGDYSERTVSGIAGPSPIIRILYPWTNTPVKLSGPTVANIPQGSGNGVAWSPNGEFLAVGHTNSSFIKIYERNSTNFTKYSGPIPTELPTGNGFNLAWSNQGDLLAIVHTTTPFITIYTKLDNSFTKASGSTGTLPTGNAVGVDFSPNGQFLAIGHANSGFITIYEKTDEIPTFTKLSLASIPTGNAEGVAFSPNGEFLAVAHANSSFVTIYQRTGMTTWTKISGPIGSELPTGTGYGVAWSPDGRYLAVGGGSSVGNSPMTLYKKSNTTFTKIPGVALEPSGFEFNTVTFSPNGQFIAAGTNGFLVESVFIYHLQNDTLKLVSMPSFPPETAITAIKWSPDGQFLAISHSLSSFVTIYQTTETPPRGLFNGVVKIIGIPKEGD